MAKQGIEINRSERTGAWDEEYDLVVLGSGGAGLTAALVGAIEGLRTLVIEKTDYLGGTTALSAGTCWIPNNSYLRQEGVQDDDVAALQYLDALVDGLADREIRTAFLAAGPEMLVYLEKQCDICWRIYKTFVDYRQEFPGAGKGGRPLEPMPFDGRKLGKNFSRVRWPVPEWALFGRQTDGDAPGGLSTTKDYAPVARCHPVGSEAGLTLSLRSSPI